MKQSEGCLDCNELDRPTSCGVCRKQRILMIRLILQMKVHFKMRTLISYKFTSINLILRRLILFLNWSEFWVGTWIIKTPHQYVCEPVEWGKQRDHPRDRNVCGAALFSVRKMELVYRYCLSFRINMFGKGRSVSIIICCDPSGIRKIMAIQNILPCVAVNNQCLP